MQIKGRAASLVRAGLLHADAHRNPDGWAQVILLRSHPGGFPDCDPIHLFEIRVVSGNISNSVSFHDIEIQWVISQQAISFSHYSALKYPIPIKGQYAYVEPWYFCDCVFAFFKGLQCFRILFQEFYYLPWPYSKFFCSLCDLSIYEEPLPIQPWKCKPICPVFSFD